MTDDNEPKNRKDPIALLDKLQGRMLEVSKPEHWFGKRKKALRPGEVRYAGFNDRVFASAFDMILSLMLLWPVFFHLAAMIYGAERAEFFYSFNFGPGHGSDLRYQLSQPGFASGWLMNSLLQTAIFGAIFIFCWTRSNTTPGKWLLRMRIVNDGTFDAPTTRQYVVRFCGSILSGLFLGLGMLWILVDRKNRAWHDIMAGTVVVKVRHWRIRPEGEPELAEIEPQPYEDVEG